MENLELFLCESNAIEGVYDDVSYDQALIAWNYLSQQDVLTPSVIRRTHGILMLRQNLPGYEKGYFRECEVMVGGQRGYPYRDVPVAIDRWCSKVATSAPEDLDPIQLHVEYEAIHPFADGNGRTGRLFLNWMNVCLLHRPFVIFRESEKHNYYKLFR